MCVLPERIVFRVDARDYVTRVRAFISRNALLAPNANAKSMPKAWLSSCENREHAFWRQKVIANHVCYASAFRAQ